MVLFSKFNFMDTSVVEGLSRPRCGVDRRGLDGRRPTCSAKSSFSDQAYFLPHQSMFARLVTFVLTE